MNISHKIVVGADDCPPASPFGTAMDRNKLAECVLFSDDDFALLPVKLQVLGNLPDRCKREKAAVLTDPAWAFDHDVRPNIDTRVDLHPSTDDGVWTNRNVGCNFGLGMNDSGGMNLAHEPRFRP